MLHDGSTAVLDIGSHSTKIGFGTASSPELIPSLAGTYKYRALPLRAARYDSAIATNTAAAASLTSTNNNSSSGCVVGRAAYAQQGLLRLRYPVQHGSIVDWSAMTSLLTQSEEVLYGVNSLTMNETTRRDVSQGAPLPATETAGTDETSTAITTTNNTSTNSDVTHTLHGRPSIYALVESPFASRVQRARLASLLFESTYGNPITNTSSSKEGGVQGIFCGVAPLLALYSTGSTTGVVIDIGEGVASTAAAINGFALTRVMQREDDGPTGQTVTNYLELLMRQYGTRLLPCGSQSSSHGSDLFAVHLSRSGHAVREVVREVKEACCAVAPQALPINGIAVDVTHKSVNELTTRTTSNTVTDYSKNEEDVALAKLDAQLTTLHNNTMNGSSQRQTYVLPDGSAIELGVEAVQAAEVLLQPALIGSEARGVIELLTSTVALAEMHIRPALYEHVVLTGGSSLMRGLGVRVLSELLRVTPREHRVRVVAPAERGYAAWLGAAFLSQLSTFVPQMVVSRAEYEEQGEAALQARLFT